MKLLRSLAAELFLSWHQRRLLRQLRSDNEASLDALKAFRSKIAMEEKAASIPVGKPQASGARSAKADPDRKDSAGGPKAQKTTDEPPRDTHEWPSKHPNGDPNVKVT